jgi:hypothetical protein
VQDAPKITQIVIFGIKIYHLATPAASQRASRVNHFHFLLKRRFLEAETRIIFFVMNSAFFFRWRQGLPDGAYIFKPKILIWVNFGGS